MSKLWRYQPVTDAWTTHTVQHPDGVVVSEIGKIDGWDYFVAEDGYIPTHEIIPIEEVKPTADTLAYLMANSPHARLLQQRMAEGPPRYSAEDAARLGLFVGYVPGLAEHIAEGRAWESA